MFCIGKDTQWFDEIFKKKGVSFKSGPKFLHSGIGLIDIGKILAIRKIEFLSTQLN